MWKCVFQKNKGIHSIRVISSNNMVIHSFIIAVSNLTMVLKKLITKCEWFRFDFSYDHGQMIQTFKQTWKKKWQALKLTNSKNGFLKLQNCINQPLILKR